MSFGYSSDSVEIGRRILLMLLCISCKTRCIIAISQETANQAAAKRGVPHESETEDHDHSPDGKDSEASQICRLDRY